MMVMCEECGRFVVAKRTDDGWRPVVDSCPDCGGTDFARRDE